MSRMAVIVSLVLALGLAAAAFFLLREAPPLASGPLLPFDPARVSSFSIQRPGGRIERIEPAAPGEWTLRISGGPGSGRDWPLAAAQVRAMLRILSTLQADQPAPDPRPGEDAITILIGTDDQSLALRLGGTPLSGRVVAQRPPDGASYWVREDVARALEQRGILAWRDPTLLAGIDTRTSRIELRGPSGSVVLSRGGGRWGLLEPVQAPADEEAVNRLAAALASARIADFLDAGAPADTGLEAPSAVARVVSTLRDETGAATDRVLELRVGRPADIAATQVYVSIAEIGASAPLVVTAATDQLAALTTDAATYIQRRGTTFPASDIGSLVVTPAGGEARTVTRTITGWASQGSEAQVPLTAEVAAAMSALTTLLSESPCDQVRLARPDAADAALAVELRTLAGSPLDTVEIFAIPSGIAIRTGEVWRLYRTPDALETVQAAGAALR